MKNLDRYKGHKQWGWYLDDQDYWVSLLQFDEGPVKALEIGAYDGVSANMMLDLLFPHLETRLHCLDPFLPDPTTPGENEEWKKLFLKNREIGGHEDQIILHEGLSFDVLTRLYQDPEERESFDFIYIDGSHFAKNVLEDAVLAWPLLDLGGYLAFDDYHWNMHNNDFLRPGPAIDVFLAIYGNRLEVIAKTGRVFIRKYEE